MATSDHAVDRRHEFPPGRPLLEEHAPAVRREPVEAATTLAVPFQPAPTDQAAALEPAQHGIQRGDAELELAERSPLDHLPDVVAMPRPVLEQRQDQQLGAPFLQLATEHRHLALADAIYRKAVDTGRRAGLSSGF